MGKAKAKAKAKANPRTNKILPPTRKRGSPGKELGKNLKKLVSLTQKKKTVKYKVKYYMKNWEKSDDYHFTAVTNGKGGVIQVGKPPEYVVIKTPFSSFEEWAGTLPIIEPWGDVNYDPESTSVGEAVKGVIEARKRANVLAAPAASRAPAASKATASRATASKATASKATASRSRATASRATASRATAASMGTINENEEASSMVFTYQNQQVAPAVKSRPIKLPIAPRRYQKAEISKALSRGRSQFKSTVSTIPMTNSENELPEWFQRIRNLTIMLNASENIVTLIAGKRFSETEEQMKAKHHSVENLLADKTTLINGTTILKYDKLREWYSVAEFLRSYVDFHHDLEYQSKDLIKDVVTLFKNQILSHLDQHVRAWYNKWMIEINSKIYKNTGNVNQDYCRNVLSNIIDELLAIKDVKDHITWIPATQERSIVHTFTPRLSSGNYNIEELYTVLRKKGIRSCFAESITTGFYQVLINHERKIIPSSGDDYLRNRTLYISEWDGGSGFVGKGINKTNIHFPVITSTTDPFYMFGGVMNVSVDMNNNILTCSVLGYDDTLILSGTKNEPQKLSLNRLLQTAGLPLLRSKKNNEKKDGKKEEKITFLIGNFTEDKGTLQQKRMFPLLKTWTDFSQIRRLSQYHGSNPDDMIAVCMNDNCLNATARMYGIPFVMLDSKTSVILYCYDSYADEEYSKKIEGDKLFTLCAVLSNIENLISLSDSQYAIFYTYLQSNTKINNNPALYFAIPHIHNMWTTIKVNMTKEVERLEKIKEEIIAEPTISDSNHQIIHLFPTKVKEWFSQFISAETLISGIEETVKGIQNEMMAIHISKDDNAWIGHYRTISNLVDNAILLDANPIYAQACRICVLVMAYRSKDSIEQKLTIMYNALRASLKDAVNQTSIGVRLANDHVSPLQFVDVFLPKTCSNSMGLFKLLRTAKEGNWSLPSHNDITESMRSIKDNVSNVCDLINALDVYRCILAVPITADCLENGLVALSLISDANCPNTCAQIIEESIKILNQTYATIPFEIIQASVDTSGLIRTISISPETKKSYLKTVCSSHYLNGARTLLPIPKKIDHSAINVSSSTSANGVCSSGFCPTNMGGAYPKCTGCARGCNDCSRNGGSYKKVSLRAKRLCSQKRKHQRRRTHNMKSKY